jgi:hypothetical protein
VYIVVNISEKALNVSGTVIRRRLRAMANILMIGISLRFDGYMIDYGKTVK